MRSLFALAAVCGLVSAGNLYSYRGTSDINLQQVFGPPSALPPVEPYGDFTNDTIIDEVIRVEEKKIVQLKIDHGVDIGYSGEYRSEEVDDGSEFWSFGYEVETYAKITETITLTVAEFYKF